MFCTYCRTTRPENEAPCPNCGAPSPLLGRSPTESWSAGGTSSMSWNNAGPMSFDWGQAPAAAETQWEQVPQMSFDAPNQPHGWERFASVQGNGQWGQAPFPSSSAQLDQLPQQAFNAPPSPPAWGTHEEQSPPDAAQSLLPVPYQGQNGLQVNQPQGVGLPAFPQPPTLGQLASSLPEDSVYVPPLYTKPRPLIPRYRIISGIISLFVVILVACGGLGYLAKTNGTLNSLAQTFTGAPPQQLAPVTGPHLPDPPNKIDQGPAFTIIPAAATASRIDMQNNTPLQPTQSFKVNQIIYLTFSVPHPNNGTVTAKWYMNNRFYRPGPPLQAKKGNDTINGRMEMAYATPAEGTVELYWNGQLAQRLFFVVRLQ